MVLMLGLVLVCCLGSAQVDADARGAGRWHTEEFTDARFLGRWGWGTLDQRAANRIEADRSTRMAGSDSIKLDTRSGFDTWVYFPNTRDLDLDARRLEIFEFSATARNRNPWQANMTVVLVDGAARRASFEDLGKRTSAIVKGWVRFQVPLGVGAVGRSKDLGWKASVEPGFDWSRVACFEIHSDTWEHGFQMWYDGAHFRGAGTARWWLSSLNRPDLSVTWVEQVPTYRRYFPDYAQGVPILPAAEMDHKRWPAFGERVVYRVHVRNVGFARSPRTHLVCRIDGRQVARERVDPLPPRGEAIVPVNWDFKNGSIPFEAVVDPDARIDEISRRNNRHAFKTDAWTLAAFMDQKTADGLDRITNGLGSFSHEDWLRASTVDTMNRLFAASRYDFAPRGAPVSVRLYGVFVEAQSREPDRSADWGLFDGAWVYRSVGLDEYRNLAHSFMNSLIHELSHQIGVVDDYRFNLEPASNRVNGKGYYPPQAGLMGGGCVERNGPSAYADVDVAGLLLTAGHRRGYYGEYLYCLPSRVVIALKTPEGSLAGAQVEVFQKNQRTELIEKPPIQKGTTDRWGRLALANRPAKLSVTTPTGCRLQPNPFGDVDVVGRNGLLLIRARHGGATWYGFLDIGRLVVEYVRGHRDQAVCRVDMTRE